MEIVKGILQIIQGLSAVLLVTLILLHSPKGDGLSMIGGTAQLFASQKGAEATLNKITAWTLGIFFAASFILGYYL